MDIFEKLKSEHIIINFIDEDGNNTLMLAKDKKSMYLYTDYNNIDFTTPLEIELDEDDIKFNVVLSGGRKVSVKVEYKNDTRLNICKKTNDKIVVDGLVKKDETSSKRKNVLAFAGDFVE